MNVLAIDFGLKNIGISVGTTESGIAFVRDVLINRDDLIENLAKIVETDHIDQILVGMPYKRDKSVGDIDAQLQIFLKLLREHFDLPIELFDERYSTKIAQQKLYQLDLTRTKRREPIDSLAAQVILQEWLDGQA